MNLIRQYASNDSIIMFGHSYDSTLNGMFKVTVIATGFSAEKASVFNARRPLPNAGMPASFSVKKPAAEDMFTSYEPKISEPEDAMLIPACLRRKKNR